MQSRIDNINSKRLFDLVQCSREISDFRKYINKNTNIHDLDQYKRTILMFAAQNYHYEIFEYLVNNHSSLITKTDNGDWNVMHFIASSKVDNKSMISLITNKKMKYIQLIWQRNKNGYLPKDLAKQNNNTEILKIIDQLMNETWNEYHHFARKNNYNHYQSQQTKSNHDHDSDYDDTDYDYHHDDDDEDDDIDIKQNMDIDQQQKQQQKQQQQQQQQQQQHQNTSSLKKRKIRSILLMEEEENEENKCPKRRRLNNDNTNNMKLKQKQISNMSLSPLLLPTQIIPSQQDIVPILSLDGDINNNTDNTDNTDNLSEITTTNSSLNNNYLPSTVLSTITSQTEINLLPLTPPQLLRSRAIEEHIIYNNNDYHNSNDDADDDDDDDDDDYYAEKGRNLLSERKEISATFYNGKPVSKKQYKFFKWYNGKIGRSQFLPMIIKHGYDDLDKFLTLTKQSCLKIFGQQIGYWLLLSITAELNNHSNNNNYYNNNYNKHCKISNYDYNSKHEMDKFDQRMRHLNLSMNDESDNNDDDDDIL